MKPPLAAALALAALAGTAVMNMPARAAAPFPNAPAAPASTDTRPQVAVLAGGCFWGMTGVFEHVQGVISVTAGYAGGLAATANYPDVTTETTGHAEAVQIKFDPRKVSYGQLLKVFFAVAHDPTDVNGQHPDSGPSYRSAVFPQNAAQRQLAAGYVAALNAAHVFPKRIATRLENGQFYAAEDYHQHFMQRNPHHPYILAWDVARVARLKATFPQWYKG